MRLLPSLSISNNYVLKVPLATSLFLRKGHVLIFREKYVLIFREKYEHNRCYTELIFGRVKVVTVLLFFCGIYYLLGSTCSSFLKCRFLEIILIFKVNVVLLLFLKEVEFMVVVY